MPTLMSVLRPFVYDPLVSWSRQSKSERSERTDSQAMTNVQHIEQRLKGYVSCKIFKKNKYIFFEEIFIWISFSIGENKWSDVKHAVIN